MVRPVKREFEWIHLVPDSWPMLRNKQILSESLAVSQEGTEELLSVSHITGITPKSEKRVTMIEAESLDGYRLVEPGDLVINMMWAWMGALGVSQHAGIVSPAYSVYRPKPGVEIDSRYFDYLYRSDAYVAEMTRHSRGIHSSRLRIYPNVFLSLRVPNPPLETQRAIADYLDRETARIDMLIEEQQRLIELLRERRGGVVDAALQPGVNWIRTTLKFLTQGIDQGVSPQAESGLADDPGSWGVLKSGCVNRGVFRQEEHKRLSDTFDVDKRMRVAVGDLIVSRASGSADLVGSAALVEELNYDLILSDKLFRLRLCPDYVPRFVYWFLNSQLYRLQVRQAISGAEGLANNLPLKSLRSFGVAVPPLEEQRRIAAYLDEQTAKIDALIAETETFIELARERRSALVTAAVTGKIDVREVA